MTCQLTSTVCQAVLANQAGMQRSVKATVQATTDSEQWERGPPNKEIIVQSFGCHGI